MCLVGACVFTCLRSQEVGDKRKSPPQPSQGDIADEKGGSVPGASVEARNLDTNYVRTETSNSDGHFIFLSFAPGRYTLTISKQGFATILQENVNLTVGQVITIPVTMKISSVSQQIVVSDVPVVEVTKTESSSTLDEAAVANTPVLGRKFEDLLTLTPGVSISQGPDGDEININGQRGIFNNISLDGGDYNNGFFGEQAGGQRAAVDITLGSRKGVPDHRQRRQRRIRPHRRRRGQRHHQVRHQ